MTWWDAVPEWLQFGLMATAVLVVFVVASGIATQARRRRARALAAAGVPLGLAYSSSSDDLRSRLASLPLFAGPGRHLCEHVLAGRDSAREEWLFEYSVLSRRQGGDDPIRRTAVYACRIARARVPSVVVAPRGAMNRLEAAVSGDGVAVASDPAFARRYDVRGEDADAVRRWLDPALAAALARLRDDWTHRIEARGEWAVVYTADEPLEPDRVATLRADGRAVATALTVRAAGSRLMQ